MSTNAASAPQEHPAYPELTDHQREAINQVWTDVCLPALEESTALRRQLVDARIAAQDARYEAALLRDELARLNWETRPDA